MEREPSTSAGSSGGQSPGDHIQHHRYGSFEETLPISPVLSGVVWPHYGNRHDHPRHRHRALEMNLVVSGRGCYEVDGHHHPLTSGSILWIRPGESHYVEERTDDFMMWIIAAERPLFEAGRLSESNLGMFSNRQSAGLSKVLPADDLRWLHREIARINEHSSPDFVRAGLAYTLLGAWEATRAATEVNPGRVLSAPLHQALMLLEQDPGWSRESLAEAVHTSAERLGRLFRAELGTGFVEYRNRVRVQRFLEIRRQRRGTLLGACLEAGFGSYAQFHRVFSEVIGTSPSHWSAV